MPNSIESLTRPFGEIPYRPPGPTTKKERVDGDDVTWSFGSPGSNVFELRAHSKGEVDNNEQAEFKRVYDVVRVKNPDDNSQHVDVEVMTEYQARNKIDEKRVRLRFAQQEPTANIEVLRRNQTRTTPLPPEYNE